MAHNLHHNHHHSHHTQTHPVTGKPTRRDFISSLVSAAVFARALGQTQTQSASTMAERFRQMSEEYESKGLATPFKGITTNGEVAPGLFEIKPSGVSTGPLRNAAENFIATLTPYNSPEPCIPWTTSSGANG